MIPDLPATRGKTATKNSVARSRPGSSRHAEQNQQGRLLHALILFTSNCRPPQEMPTSYPSGLKYLAGAFLVVAE